MKIIDGKKIAERIKDEIVSEILSKNEQKNNSALNRPNLAIIMAGDREDSKLYTDIKQKEAKKVGIDTHFYKLEEKEGQAELLSIIKHLNEDEEIDAIMIQLPLPEKFDTEEVLKAINPKKDVECLHPRNFKLCQEGGSLISPPVFGAIEEILEEIDWTLKGKKICIIGNSKSFVDGLSQFLSRKGGDCLTSGIKDKDLKSKSSQADLVVSAVGEPGFLRGYFIKEGAVVIDVGITKQKSKTLGDADFESIKKKASFATPVPGGVGPVTVAILLKNTLALSKK
ncbi:MAG: bifunctional 5,10-methylenetetrahydrofolate dehydrogenase/5,10-methenyltetrahydrofolate cyclohydrolase [Patescibacteria group bacterium]